MNGDARAQAQNFIPARLVSNESEMRVLVFRFSAMGLSFCAPMQSKEPPWKKLGTAQLELNLPDGTTFAAEGRILSWRNGEVPGVGRCILVEMQIPIEPKAGTAEAKGFNRRRTARLELKENQPRCVVTHPLFANTRMEFFVCDVSASGMRLATAGQVVALFPQFVFSGEIIFADSTKIPVRFQVRHIHFDSLGATHVVGAQFVDNNILMLSSLSRKLLTTCHVDSEALRQSRLHYVFPARHSRREIPRSALEVRVVENLDEWQRVLHFRLAAMRAAGQVKDKSDIRVVMSPRDALSTHLVAILPDGQLVATATLLQVARLGREQRRLLPYGHHTDPHFEAFWDFSQYFLSPLHPGHVSLEALLGFALSHAAQAECPCIVASVPPEWGSVFDAMSFAPTVIERSEGPAGSASVYYYLAGDAQERYLTDDTPPPPEGRTDETGALSVFFRKIIRNKEGQ